MSRLNGVYYDQKEDEIWYIEDGSAYIHIPFMCYHSVVCYVVKIKANNIKRGSIRIGNL